MKVSARKSSRSGARLIIIATLPKSIEFASGLRRCREMFRERRRRLGWGVGVYSSGGEGLALLNVRRLGQVVALIGPSKDERLSQMEMQKCCKCCV
jgi:hypothetical protein